MQSSVSTYSKTSSCRRVLDDGYDKRGEAPDMEGTGRRNAHLLAIAPNANSSIICGTSPSIEPLKANAYTHRTRAGSHLVKNKYLAEELDKIDKNTDRGMERHYY